VNNPDQPALPVVERRRESDDLAERISRLPAGLPSSPFDERSRLREAEPSLADVERPIPPLSDADWTDHVSRVRTALPAADHVS